MIHFWFTGFSLIACLLISVAQAQEPGTWHQRQSGAFLSDCCFGGGKFVVVGDSGTIQNSFDGTNWITHKLGNNVLFNGIAYGSGKYVAVGGEHGDTVGHFSSWKGVVFVSTDADHWSRLSESIAYALFGICFGDGEFVAVGAEGVGLKSNDGYQWKTIGSGGDDHLYGAAYGNGKLVVVGGEVAKILTFDNGALVKSQLIRGASKLRRVIFANNRFIAVGGALKADLLISADGVEWLRQNSSGAFGPLTAIAFGDGRFVAVGQSGTILTSADATTWTPQPPKIQNNLYGICFGDRRFLAVGSGPVILESEPFGVAPK